MELEQYVYFFQIIKRSRDHFTAYLNPIFDHKTTDLMQAWWGTITDRCGVSGFFKNKFMKWSNFYQSL